jgi:hypothetical protein
MMIVVVRHFQVAILGSKTRQRLFLYTHDSVSGYEANLRYLSAYMREMKQIRCVKWSGQPLGATQPSECETSSRITMPLYPCFSL